MAKRKAKRISHSRAITTPSRDRTTSGSRSMPVTVRDPLKRRIIKATVRD